MLRELASAFSTRVVRELSRPHPAHWACQRVEAVAALVDGDVSLADAFDAAYERLVAEYQCEYVYKSALIRHVTDTDPTANALTGLPVFLSIADVVVAGQAAAAFEIKTDLDSFSRLDLQLVSYSRCFEHVYVLTSERKAAHALDVVPCHVGVMALDDEAVLATARPAGDDGYARLDISSLFRVLRQSERLAVLQRQLGYVADVPAALLYRRTAELFNGLTIEVAYSEFMTELRDRDSRQWGVAQTVGLPHSLRASAAGLALSGAAWRRLGATLHSPARALLTSNAFGAS